MPTGSPFTGPTPRSRKEELSEHRRPEDVVRSLTMLSNFWIQLFDHVGAVLAEAHAVEDGLIVAQGTRSYDNPHG